MTYADRIVDAVLKVTDGPIGNHPPEVNQDDINAVTAQLKDLGNYNYMTALEVDLAQRCRRSHAVAVASGSAGLELALTAVGVGPGDSVSVPAISFIAAANAVRRVGAAPLFVDVEPNSLGMDPDLLKESYQRLRKAKMRVPRAVIAVHVLGHPCRIREIEEVAESYGVDVIEDAAEALGSAVGTMPCGGFGRVSVISCNVNKIVTSGGGGVALTNDEWMAERIRRVATTGRVPHAFEIAHYPGCWNYRMAMPSAALAYSQLQRLKHLVKAKRALAAFYREVFCWMDDVMFLEEPQDTFSNFWLPSIIVKREEREAALTALNQAGLCSRALFTPIPRMAPYQHHDSFPVADMAHATTVCLPGGIKLAERFL